MGNGGQVQGRYMYGVQARSAAQTNTKLRVSGYLVPSLRTAQHYDYLTVTVLRGSLPPPKASIPPPA